MPGKTPKGTRYGGRKRGTPNKRTQDLLERAAALKIDPFEVLLLFAKGDWKRLGYEAEQYLHSASENGSFFRYTIDPNTRAKAASEACQYLYPKRKAIEVTGKDGQPLSFVQLVQECSGDDPGRSDD